MTNKPSPDLLTNKQEKFCQAVIQGMSYKDAYIYAYNTENSQINTIYQSASELANLPKIKLRITELRNIEFRKQIMSPDEIKARLSRIGRAELADFMDDSGEDLRPFNKSIPGHEAVREVSIRTGTNQAGKPYTRKSLKLINPIEAIQELNKMQGNHAPVRTQNENITFEIEVKPKPPRHYQEQDFVEPD